MDYREKIDEYLRKHKDEMVSDIIELCRINSERMPYSNRMPFGRGTAQALRMASDMGERYGFSVRNYDNFVGTIDLNDKEPQLDILAHLDVVPAGEGWTVTKPFNPVVKDGRIYGRGTADDKGPAVAALYAMRAIKDLGIPVSKNCRLILGTDEESGSTDILHYYHEEPEAPMTFSPDAHFPVTNVEKGRLAGEISGTFRESEELPRIISVDAGIRYNVVPDRAECVIEGFNDDDVRAAGEKITAETGVRFTVGGRNDELRVEAFGETAHASTPAEGKNALTALMRLLSILPFADAENVRALKHLEKLFPWDDTEGRSAGVAMEDEISGAMTVAFSLFHMTGTELNAGFDARIPAVGNEENVLKVLKKKIGKHRLELLNTSMTPPHVVDGDSDFIRTLNRNYEEVTGLPGGCKSTGGGTYVHNLKNGVAFGTGFPGMDYRMHGADEFAVIDELVKAAQIFARCIAELCA
ncbi:MAG: Sapep family Mn(2+)-dependent dipeptidase [Clostridium sp.]|nr:Sapep family Mn(2+)-dependent dipeptidase [Clostridium sp.]